MLYSDPLQELEEEHSTSAITKRLKAKKRFNYLGDAILGAIDGCVTTFAVVAGVFGGRLNPKVALLLGSANLLADGFSMAVSNYQRAKSDSDLIKKIRRTEERHVEHIPEGEREEIYQIFKQKGFGEPTLSNIVDVITKDKKLWIDTMVMEEFGLQLEGSNPLKASLVTLLAFVLVGVIPLVPFVFTDSLANSQTFLVSIGMTGFAFFLVGLLKGRILRLSPFLSGLETLSVGGGAAFLAYLAGTLLRGIL